MQKGLFATLLLLSLFFLYAERQKQPWVGQVRAALMEVTMPVVSVLSSPVQAVQDMSEGWTHLWTVYEENTRLRENNAQLLEWRNSALRLEAENEALRKLLDYQPQEAKHFTTAKVVNASYGNLSHKIYINMGKGSKVGSHMAVINDQGLVGRVLEASENKAEVLLLTDMSSRIPVTLHPSGARAILVGDHHRLPYLKFADPKATPDLGDVVMTSTDGGVLPAGIYIGKLFAQNGKRWEVRPAFKKQRLDFVRVIHPRHSR